MTDTFQLIQLLIILVVLAGIFIAAREFVMWYWKINKRIEQNDTIIGNQEKIIELLERPYNKGVRTKMSDEEIKRKAEKYDQANS